MISTIRIRNFKSLKDVSLQLKNLNIITGMNGVGKSSIIQSILLLRQSYLRKEHLDGISLDGELTGNLGSVGDVENIASDNQTIEITINDCTCLFNTKDRSNETILRGKYNLNKLKSNPIFSPNKFQYISASRISPDTQFKKNTYNAENKQFGKNGEFVVSYINEYGKKNSLKQSDQKFQALINLALDDKENKLPLESQINFWLNYVSEDVRLDIIKTTNTKYELRFEFFNGTNWKSFSAENSAFGLTYSLPVIASLLAASPGDVIIIENPESDLHPQAQSKLGELIARCAEAGVQLIIETHSDHILNGIRVAVSKKPSLLSSEKVKVFYFFKELDSAATNIQVVDVDKNGRMPIKELKARGIGGFFDQIDNDYLTLLRNQNV